MLEYLRRLARDLDRTSQRPGRSRKARRSGERNRPSHRRLCSEELELREMMSGVPTLESLMSTVHDDVAQQSAPIIESSSSDNVTLAASDVPATLAAATTTATPTAKSQGIWISHEELMSIPTSGAAWDALVKAANTPTGTPNLS
ncbi:MAG: hypothetical protein ABFD16_15425, partial [Thermoguttaceae bacterium]